MTNVDFHFDLMCPWAYQTSKWIRQARAQRDISVTWRFFSLEEENWQEGEKHPWERPWSYGWSLLRLAAWLRREPDGNEAVDRFYEVAGRMFHEEGVKVHTPEGAYAVLRELGRDPGIVDEAIGDETTNAEVRTDHQRAVARGVYGVPTLVIDDADVLFGPVITPARPAWPPAGCGTPSWRGGSSPTSTRCNDRRWRRTGRIFQPASSPMGLPADGRRAPSSVTPGWSTYSCRPSDRRFDSLTVRIGRVRHLHEQLRAHLHRLHHPFCTGVENDADDQQDDPQGEQGVLPSSTSPSRPIR